MEEEEEEGEDVVEDVRGQPGPRRMSLGTDRVRGPGRVLTLKDFSSMALPQRTEPPQASRMEGWEGGRAPGRGRGGVPCWNGHEGLAREAVRPQPSAPDTVLRPAPSPRPRRRCRRTAVGQIPPPPLRPAGWPPRSDAGPARPRVRGAARPDAGAERVTEAWLAGSAPTPARAPLLAPSEWHARSGRLFPLLTPALRLGGEARGGSGRDRSRDPRGREMNRERRGAQEPACRAGPAPGCRPLAQGLLRSTKQSMRGTEPAAVLPYAGTSLSRRRPGPRGRAGFLAGCGARRRPRGARGTTQPRSLCVSEDSSMKARFSLG